MSEDMEDEGTQYDFESEKDRANFNSDITVFANKMGWGPAGPCEKEFENMPYQPFSKSDRLGKAADITGTTYRGRANRYQSMFGAGDAYGYFHGEDESSFSLVNSTKKPLGMFQKRRWQNRTRRDLHRARDDRRMAGMQPLSKGQKSRERDRIREERRWQKRWAGRRRVQDRRDIRDREASVDVKSTWKILEEIEFPRLSKLTKVVAAPEDLLTCGTLGWYDKAYDRVNLKQPRPLQQNNKLVFHTVTTTEDPNIRQLVGKVKGEKATVFGTDAILSKIMCCQRSSYSWDVVIDKLGDKIFFDKRDNSEFDYVTASETANESPVDDGTDSINAPERLAFEATYVNRMFSQMVLKKREKKYSFKDENPFAEDDEEVASIGYRYRKWDLGDGITLVARTEHDAVYKTKDGNTGFMNIKTFNEWKENSTMEWRQKLDSQRGAILATELKNNALNVARWTLSALLAGSSQLRLGYVSRSNMNDAQKHAILGNQLFKPKDLAQQINLNINNCWAVLRLIIDQVLKLEDGRYVLLKDPNKHVLRLYTVPEGTFDDDDDSDEDDDSDGEEESIGIRVNPDDDVSLA
eukprot:m.21853 g.21853  ORF g.21853 m.21853 type:complete len:579 (-) comp13572_c0_seq1:190-1926(-)